MWCLLLTLSLSIAPEVSAQQPAQETRLGPLDKQRSGEVFSSDGRHFAYVTVHGKKLVVVLDGRAREPGGEYDDVSGLQFSPDGKRLAYCAWNATAKKYRIVLDGRDGQEFNNMSAPVFSSDSRQRQRAGCVRRAQWK